MRAVFLSWFSLIKHSIRRYEAPFSADIHESRHAGNTVVSVFKDDDNRCWSSMLSSAIWQAYVDYITNEYNQSITQPTVTFAFNYCSIISVDPFHQTRSYLLIADYFERNNFHDIIFILSLVHLRAQLIVCCSVIQKKKDLFIYVNHQKHISGPEGFNSWD